jgi:mRNA-degrading endonuclease toxin of MazEF toxin-antitoxin module
MNNDFDKWNELKKKLNDRKINLKFKARDIFFMSIGKNIGSEQLGKGEEFLRPILVYKKLGEYYFLGIPLTSQEKVGSYYFPFKYKKDKLSVAMLNQIRTFDIRRHKYHDGYINRKLFKKLEEKMIEFMRVTPQKEEDGHRGLKSNESISQTAKNVNQTIKG